MCDKEQIKDSESVEKGSEVNRCLNCGTELNGPFCHMCGQEYIDPKPTVGNFISVYLDNAYMLDIKLFKTIWDLVSKPGHLAKEFLAGKIVSNIHPLKLNMFLLLAFLTIFFIFADTDAIEKPLDNIVRDERFVSNVQMSFLVEDQEYVEKMAASPRDSVLMYAPTTIALEYPAHISCAEVFEDNEGDAMDRWIAVIPRCLIEDDIVIVNEEGYYSFNAEEIRYGKEINMIQDVTSHIFNIITTYLPIIVLFTIPFLAMALARTQRKNKRPFIHHFVFSLYYTSFVELMILFIYVLYLVASPPVKVMEWIMILSLFFYLAAAIKNAYDMKSWIRAMIRALYINVIYLFNCLVVFIVICLIACFIVADKYI